MRLIEIQGVLYNQLGMYGGKVYLGKPLDVNNEVVKAGIIWEMQPFKDEKEINTLIKTFVYVVRYFSRDVFGQSQFLKDIGYEN